MTYAAASTGTSRAFTWVVLRTTVLYSRDLVRVVLKGELVGEWADCVPQSITLFCSQGEIEIDLDGITCVDHSGEQVLLALQQVHRRFLGTSLFARTLCERLGIPVEMGAR